MYETLEFYDVTGCDLKEVLKCCVYRYYIANKKVFNNRCGLNI